jgi:hypothetical protein
MSEPSERRIQIPASVERTPIPLAGGRARGGEVRHLEAWREWLRALASNAEAALAAALLYRGLDGDGRDAWLKAVEQDTDGLDIPKFAVYAPLLAVESDPDRRERIQAAIGPSEAASPRAPAEALVGKGRDGTRIAVLISPLYLDFVQVMACAYRPEVGFEWVRHDPIVERKRAPQHGAVLDGSSLESTPLKALVDDLAYVVLAHRRSGRELPEALKVFADLFGPSTLPSQPPPSEPGCG